MAWTTPRTWAVNDFTDASMLNTHFRDNMNVSEAAILTATGDMAYSTAAHAIARLPIGGAGYVLDGTSPPAWIKPVALTSGQYAAKMVLLTGINATPQTLIVSNSGFHGLFLQYIAIPSTGTPTRADITIAGGSTSLYVGSSNLDLSIATDTWSVVRTGGALTFTLIAFVLYKP